MKKSIILSFLVLFSINMGQAQFGKLLDKAKSEGEKILGKEDSGVDIAGGLKEALDEGVKEAVTSLSKENGYYDSPYKILIPQDAQKVISKVKHVPGFQNVEEELLTKMNQAAELAAKKATPIFVNAIKDMSFSDAKKILFGKDDAGTRYLESSARGSLYKEFMPIIQSALNEVNATKYWNSVVTKYNAIPLTKDVNPNLDDHVNNKGLDGLFGLIQVKEDGIRKDVGQRTSPLLKDVFGQLD